MTIDSKTTRIALGTDHAGFAYKEAINSFLLEKGYQTKDFGTFSEESVDYPVVRPAAEAVAEGLCSVGNSAWRAETEGNGGKQGQPGIRSPFVGPSRPPS